MEKFKGNTSLQIRASDEDIRTVLDSKMEALPSFVLDRPDLQEEIRVQVVKAADGMFLLATLHVDSLREMTTAKHLKTALDCLPKDIDDVYKKAVKRIDDQSEDQKSLAKKVIAWITFSTRDLTTLELKHAIAVEVNTSGLDKDNIPKIQEMVSVCAGLVTVDESSNTIRLVHYTTHDYMKRELASWYPSAHIEIARACATYVLFDTFGTGRCSTIDELEERFQSNPFYDYAARNLGHHFRTSGIDGEQLILDLLDDEIKVSACSQAMMVPRLLSPFHFRSIQAEMTGLQLAAYYGLAESIRALVDKQQDPNLEAQNSHGRTALLLAAENGHEAVVKLLLDKGADKDIKDDDRQTALFMAAQNGHQAVVKLLLDKGAKLDTKDDNGRTALLYTAYNGNEAVVKLLLDQGADLEAKDEKGRTALLWASENGHTAVVKLLLDKVTKNSQ
ncbi:hypothetical protein SI65_05251 [Aspergillus cristatus]|uniref:GPI inositol-deacylase winged helix domain-containing protein n=1 Tax=Aspergillus cristatus TaxID=573508 RepID=A0A1E3BCG7_ASPCR|nr:hypothetical protein SI65_05251 [Aspergillus cristatus]